MSKKSHDYLKDRKYAVINFARRFLEAATQGVYTNEQHRNHC